MADRIRISNSASRRIILGATLILGAAAVVLIFAPTELAGSIGAPHAAVVTILLQLYGAALFGLAMTGWMVQGAIVGGVFGRSYVVGNAAHAFVGAFTLTRPAIEAGAAPVLQVIAGIYWLLAFTFGYLMFVSTPRS
ncbi:MAG TPA: hypothetical protein VLI40_12315 [Gemmatimonadaceae bacterium]|nr:hypothetical protein [Gemmatimonadaceae bacterium]